jgi:hypothetical protein
MSSKHYLFVGSGRTFPCKAAAETEFVTRFVGSETASGVIDLQDGERIEITADRLRNEPRGTARIAERGPAAPAHDDDDSGGLSFLVDGDEPCAPMHAPPALLSLIKQVAPFESPSGGREYNKHRRRSSH